MVLCTSCICKMRGEVVRDAEIVTDKLDQQRSAEIAEIAETAEIAKAAEVADGEWRTQRQPRVRFWMKPETRKHMPYTLLQIIQRVMRYTCGTQADWSKEMPRAHRGFLGDQGLQCKVA